MIMYDDDNVYLLDRETNINCLKLLINCLSVYNHYLAIKPSSNPLLFPCGNLRRETIPSEMTKAGKR